MYKEIQKTYIVKTNILKYTYINIIKKVPISKILGIGNKYVYYVNFNNPT